MRIYRQHELEQKLESSGLYLRGSHHAHALHSPYWWLKCSVGVENADAPAVRKYHDLLAWQITTRPAWLERGRAHAQPRARQEPRHLHGEGGLMPRAQLPEVPGVITAAQIAETVDAIARIQEPDGNIPWTPGNHTDPWNLVEAAMALDVGGKHAEAEHAYEWLRTMQRPDGAWHAYTVGREIKDPTLDTNVTGYVANGVWHHYLSTGDTAFLEEFWTVVEPAIDYVLTYQRESGEIAWRGDDPDDGALLTGSSSLYASLRCAIAIAERLGHERPDWELSLGSLAIAIAHRPDAFLDKDRWAMDWYYPILGGALRGHAAHARVAAGWEHVRRRGPRRALRLRPAVGHRRRDVRVRDGARRDRRRSSTRAGCSRGCSSCGPTAAATGPARTSTTSASTTTASSTPSSSPPGTPPRSCSRRTRSAAPARPPACSAARASPSASPPTSSSPRAKTSKPAAPPTTRASARYAHRPGC